MVRYQSNVVCKIEQTKLVDILGSDQSRNTYTNCNWKGEATSDGLDRNSHLNPICRTWGTTACMSGFRSGGLVSGGGCSPQKLGVSCQMHAFKHMTAVALELNAGTWWNSHIKQPNLTRLCAFFSCFSIALQPIFS